MFGDVAPTGNLEAVESPVAHCNVECVRLKSRSRYLSTLGSTRMAWLVDEFRGSQDAYKADRLRVFLYVIDVHRRRREGAGRGRPCPPFDRSEYEEKRERRFGKQPEVVILCYHDF